jgi:hypothetical protein
MSEFVETIDSWDYTKNIKDLEVNTGYISGIENILIFYITNIVEDPSTLAVTFNKFNAILKNEVKEEDKIELSDIERHMYILFSLLQLFKIKAYEQKLNVKIESNVTKEQLQEYLMDVMKGDDATAKEKLDNIMSLMKRSS